MNERPIEYSFVFKWLNRSPKSVLDVGTGDSPLPAMMKKCGIPLVHAIDVVRPKMPHCKVSVFDITTGILRLKYDAITCISVLEHIKNYKVAVKNMAEMLNKGGLLIMTFPYNENEYIENAYDLPDSKYRWGRNICRQYCANDIKDFCRHGLKCGEIERWCIFDGLYWSCGNRLLQPFKVVDPKVVHHLACVVLEKL
jgi:hypothetical protein